MKVKMLGLLAVAATAIMVFAASASADYLSTTTGGATAEPTIHAVNESTHVVLANSIANIECQSTTEGKPNSHGTGKPVSGPISTLTFTGCTNSWHVTVNAPGTLSVKANGVNHGGALTSNGANVTTTRFGVTCNYETSNTAIGTVTGGSPATLHIEASIPIAAGSSFLCGSGNAKWEGAYVTTSALYVNAS